MTEQNRADQFLIEQIQSGNEDGWTQLVGRYHGRLLAFAKSQLRDKSQADDIVQETFIGFLKGLDRFRTKSSLETYLFTILRRRLVDCFRRTGRRDEINLCSLQDSNMDSSAADFFQPESSDLSSSQYAINTEEREQQEDALWGAIREAIQRLKDEKRFRDLQIVEMLFYAQLRNKDIGQLVGIDEKQVALVKHRLIKRLAESLGGRFAGNLADESMLSRMWEEHRPSCPKRSTVGKWLMGTLEPDWAQYVEFHVEKLGCRFCQANREDLRADTEPADSASARQRIMQSSVGFFRTR